MGCTSSQTVSASVVGRSFWRAALRAMKPTSALGMSTGTKLAAVFVTFVRTICLCVSWRLCQQAVTARQVVSLQGCQLLVI